MNFEQPSQSPETIELPPELIAMAKKGLQEAASTHDSLTEVTQVMVARGMDDTDRKAYLEILAALARLKQDQIALENHLKL
ncbi:hypothetical protein GF391_02880 [Candidatus Uhrbacteria bacterium]|nr:hypothetical protein [Candidatus Uhrbacteria bacterium]